MADFVSAFKQGLQAADQARKNREEIKDVISRVTAALKEATDDALALYTEEHFGGFAAFGALGAVLSGGKRQLPLETWISAKNFKATPPKSVQLARIEEPNEGYPVTLIYDQRQEHAHDKESFERALASFSPMQ